MLCDSVSAQPLLRRTHIEYTHLAIRHGATSHGSGASSRLAQKIALVFSEQYSVCESLHQVGSSWQYRIGCQEDSGVDMWITGALFSQLVK